VKIEKLTIDNFKSLNNFTLDNPNPFSVFVGANGVGKSNIFEALDYMHYSVAFKSETVEDVFGGYKNFINNTRHCNTLDFKIKFKNLPTARFLIPDLRTNNDFKYPSTFSKDYNPDLHERDFSENFTGLFRLQSWPHIVNKFDDNSEGYYNNQFIQNFSRIFINANEKQKFNINSDSKLSLDCSNLEKVLKRLLLDERIKEEIIDWLSLFIPAFKNIEIKSDEFSGTDTLQFFEKDSNRPFTKNLISDGTYNILCLLVAVYQSDSPQFICIEEPENGLNPYVVTELVTFFREQCREKGHYIWINTHSETLVRALLPEEIIVVNKVDGNTIAKQFKDKDMHGLSMDTAWLTNFLEGGIPW